MVTSWRRRVTGAETRTPACRHDSTVVRETPSRRAATATDTLGSSRRLWSSRTWAACLTRCSSSLPAAMSCSRATSATTCSARSYSLATDTSHLPASEQYYAISVQSRGAGAYWMGRLVPEIVEPVGEEPYRFPLLGQFAFLP